MVIRLNYSYITVYFNIWQCIKSISPAPPPSHPVLAVVEEDQVEAREHDIVTQQ